MNDIEDIRRRLRSYRVIEICYQTGLSQGTVYGILSGRNENPSYKTMTALDRFLREKEDGVPGTGKKA